MIQIKNLKLSFAILFRIVTKLSPNLVFIPRLPEVNQLGGLMKWITGFDSVNGQNCMILNFGWLAENSLPQLVTNIDDEVFDVEIVRRSSHSNCFLVFIGGKYVNRVNDIALKMDKVSNELVSNQIIYFVEKSNKTIVQGISQLIQVIK